MATIKFYAVTNNNGLISQELSANTAAEAVREVKAAVSDRSAQAWLDDNQTDLEVACGVDTNGMTYDNGLQLCSEAGAEFVWGEPSDDTWNVWSFAQ
jgi:hypothetical protein